ncbi:sucrose-phosphatase 2-like isoform X2 [Hibiscus syriacus]|uniref:sucrose-phosphatase 2-like isoform X2 n=1 Tax=Hibiscus syriacus TaxID=106335 RepID=UPI001921677C|nr:sucrose-phosphatase 2-like isoform X2 [Hibiscus syriacus]
MDRLNGPPHLMIVSDLDFTMVDHEDPENLSLLRFNSLWEAYYRQVSLLVYSTGRSPTIYKQLRKVKPLLTPDITIMSVGTEIAYGESMVSDSDWEHCLNLNWNRDIVFQETAKFSLLIPQPDTEQRPHKVSFFLEKPNSSEVIKALSERLEKLKLDVKIIYSNGTALDVLPKGAGKGQALAYLLRKFKAKGRIPLNSLVCGDSGNDAELFTIPEVYGVMVSNAQEELLQWHAENAKINPNIFHSSERCASGIIQAIGKCRVNFFSPGYEVVKFYLFYERWRRAEVEKSDQILQNLKSSFYPLGTFVHPCGTEQPMNKCTDTIERLYGDKRGKQYQIWLDRVLTSQVGSDVWLVKFDKWESTGEERYCCLTTVLLTTKQAEESFTWMHIHQTWLDGLEAKDQSVWFL